MQNWPLQELCVYCNEHFFQIGNQLRITWNKPFSVLYILTGGYIRLYVLQSRCVLMKQIRSLLSITFSIKLQCKPKVKTINNKIDMFLAQVSFESDRMSSSMIHCKIQGNFNAQHAGLKWQQTTFWNICFLIFPRKQVWHFMQFVSWGHAFMQFVKACFFGK